MSMLLPEVSTATKGSRNLGRAGTVGPNESRLASRKRVLVAFHALTDQNFRDSLTLDSGSSPKLQIGTLSLIHLSEL